MYRQWFPQAGRAALWEISQNNLASSMTIPALPPLLLRLTFRVLVTLLTQIILTVTLYTKGANVTPLTYQKVLVFLPQPQQDPITGPPYKTPLQDPLTRPLTRPPHKTPLQDPLYPLLTFSCVPGVRVIDWLYKVSR